MRGRTPRSRSEASTRTASKLTAALVAALMVTVGLSTVAVANHGNGEIVVCETAGTCGIDGAKDFQDIQAALDHASDGDTVEVHPGTYGPTRLSITNENLELTSENGPQVTTIEVAGGGEDPIAIRADGVTVRGLTFDHTTGREEFNVENFDETLEGVTIERNVIKHGHVLARDVQDLTIRNNDFTTASGIGFSIYGVFLHFGGFQDVTIEDNTFEEKLFGAVEVTFGPAENIDIVDNTFENNNNGIVVREETDTAVEAHENTFVGNSDAVDNKGDDPVDVTRNWWGDATGPTHPTNPVGGGDEIAGPALFAPWCLLDDCQLLGTPTP